MSIGSKLLKTALALAAGTLLVAQAAPGKEEDDAFKALEDLLNTPVTSASKTSQRTIEAPSVISVVSRDQIQAYGWFSLNDLLYRQPGFSASIDFNHHTASSRGSFESFPANHLLHLVDGIPMNDPLYGTAWTWDVTPLFMAKTVEVLRGPGSALYGSNATNGVVHVKSLSAADLLSGGEALLRFSDKGERIVDAALGLPGSLFTSVVGFQTLQSPGNEYPSHDGGINGHTDPAGNFQKIRTQDHHRSQYAWLKLEGQEALKGWTLQYHALAFNWEFGQGNINLIPDHPENLDEGRNLFTLAYEKKGPVFSQDYLLRYQQRRLSWYTREFPDGISAFGFDYPNGIWEHTDTTISDWFGRAQWNWALSQGSALLVGAEIDKFIYNGDRAHFANINTDTLEPFPNGQMRPVGPFMEWLLDKPWLNTAAFLQFTSGRLLGERLTATLGLRSDRLALDYIRIYEPGKPGASKTFSATSPRLALVYLAQDNLAFKLMVGKAFRAPAPIELGASHSFFTLSNLEGGAGLEPLKPEFVNTGELAVDWIIGKNLNWRTNLFRTKISNQIGYDNFSRLINLYTLTTEGLETELFFGFGRSQGFINYSFARRRGEEIPASAQIAPSPGRLTWYPAHMLNFGITTTLGKVKGSLSGHYQGKVERRATEVGTQVVPFFSALNLDAHRPRTLGGWFSLDAKAGYEWVKGTSLGLVATNLLDTKKNLLFKNLAFPYDYQGEGRRLSLVLTAKF
jgi:iron complex outermembrane receptor protein